MKNTGFRSKLILVFSLLVIVIGGIITAGLNYYFTNTYKTRARQYLAELSRMAENSFEINIEKIERISQNVLSDSTVQRELGRLNAGGLSAYELNQSEAAIRNVLSEQILFEDGIFAVSVTDLNGNAVKSSKNILTVCTGTEKSEEVMEKNGALVWKAVTDGSGCMTASRAVLNLETMKPAGQTTVFCDASYFGGLIQNITGSYASDVFVVAPDGCIVCSNISQMIPGETKLPEELMAADKEIVWFDGGEAYIYTGVPMANGWRMVSLISTVLIEGELGDIRGTIILISAACILAGIAAIIGMTGKMTKPLTDLSESMEAMEAADFSKRVKIRSHDELGRLSQQYNHMADSIEKLIEQVYKMEISQKQVEIELLKMQINPHFLYNTLDTVNWMARIGLQNEIVEVTTALAQLLRASIKQGNFVTVSEEMTSVKNYMHIQQFRFGDKIHVAWHIDDAVLDYVIPHFILQPLVENAVIHGLEPKIEQGHLSVTGKVADGQIYFSVEDDGIGMDKKIVSGLLAVDEEHSYNNHIGIRNVMLRLKNYYNGKAVFLMASEPGRGTKIELYIPEEITHDYG